MACDSKFEQLMAVPWPQVRLFGITFDALNLASAADAVLAQACAPRHDALRYVVTPNVDHVVRFQQDAALRAAYAGASLVVVDGRPVVVASRWLGQPLPAAVPGSDLVPAVLQRACDRNVALKVYLFGAGPGVAEAAAESIHRQWGRCIKVVGAVSPEFGFERDAALSARYAEAISSAAPDLVLVGLGMPKQELFVFEHRLRIQAGVAMCIGATLDFLAGNKSRAPVWIRRIGMEWCYRMLQEPRRLVKRYAYDGWVFPRLILRERAARRGR